MNKIIMYLLVVFLAFFAIMSSCSDEKNIDVTDGNLILSFSHVTSEVEAGENKPVDFRMDDFKCYIATGLGDDDDIILTYTKEFFKQCEDLGNHTVKYKTPILIKDRKKLVGKNLYAIIVSGCSELLKKKIDKVGSLRQVSINAQQGNFKSQEVDHLVMVGSSHILMRERNFITESSIEMKRLAAKIIIDITCGGKWSNDYSIDLGNASVKVCNLLQKCTLAGISSDVISQSDYMPVDKNNNCRAIFYTYPSDWNADINKEVYAIVKLPYGNGKSFYYKVLINDITKNLKSNNYYKLNLHLNQAGSNQEPSPVEVSGKLKIYDYEDVELISDYHRADYLMVEHTNVSFYGVNEIRIPYVSSRKCTYTDLKVYVQTLTEDRPNLVEINDIVYGEYIGDPLSEHRFTHRFDFKIKFTDRYIIIEHELNEHTEWEYRPYKIKFKVVHDVASPVVQPVEIEAWQYPAQYVEAECNTGNLGKDIYTNEYQCGYVYVGGSLQKHVDFTGESKDLWDDVAKLNKPDTDTKNFNMYIITVGSNSIDKNMMIGDPRDDAGGNIERLLREAVKVKDENGQTIKKGHYKACRKDSVAKKIISPKLRVASSHGASWPLTESYAKLRCAAYQEDGFLAGRWRVPTYAEVRYIINLSSNGRIPPLFSEDTDYWCSTGVINVDKNHVIKYNEDLNFSSKAYVRCVYDEWYWPEVTKGLERFTWGVETELLQ